MKFQKIFQIAIITLICLGVCSSTVSASEVYPAGLSGMGSYIGREAPVIPPVNDEISLAYVFMTLPYTNTQNTEGATIGLDDPETLCGYNNAASVWYTYTPLTSGLIEIDTIGSDYDTVLHVYEDLGGGSYQPVSCNDTEDIGYTSQSRVVFQGEAMQPYLIGITANMGGSGGSLTLNVDTYTCPADAICAVVKDHAGGPIVSPALNLYPSGGGYIFPIWSSIAGYIEAGGLSPDTYDVDILGTGVFISASGWGLGYHTISAEPLAATTISALDILGNPTIDGRVMFSNGRSSGGLGTFDQPDSLTVYATPGTYDVFISDYVSDDYALLSEGESIGAGGGSIVLDASTMPLDEVTFYWDGVSQGAFWVPVFDIWGIYLGEIPSGHTAYISLPGSSYTLDAEMLLYDSGDTWYYDFWYSCEVTGSPYQDVSFTLGGTFTTDLLAIDPPYASGGTGRLEMVVEDAYGHVLDYIDHYDADGGIPPEGSDRLLLETDQKSYLISPIDQDRKVMGRTGVDQGIYESPIPQFNVEDALGNPVSGALLWDGFRSPYEFDIPDPADTGTWYGDVWIDFGPYQADGMDDVYFEVLAEEPDRPGFYVPGNYRWYLKTGAADGWAGVISFGWGGASELMPVTGDWDGDGVDTAAFYKPSQWKWYLKNDQADGWVGTTSLRWGGDAEMIPIAGDWDGDGDDTIGFFKPADSEWYLKDENTEGWSGFTKVVWGGASGNIPIVGDWDGDGDDTIGFYVPSQNKWWLKNDLVDGWTSVSSVNFGTADPMDPVTGDWDNDGVDTVGGYVPSKWSWFLKDDQVDGWSNVFRIRFGVTAGYEVLAGDWQ